MVDWDGRYGGLGRGSWACEAAARWDCRKVTCRRPPTGGEACGFAGDGWGWTIADSELLRMAECEEASIIPAVGTGRALCTVAVRCLA